MTPLPPPIWTSYLEAPNPAPSSTYLVGQSDTAAFLRTSDRPRLDTAERKRGRHCGAGLGEAVPGWKGRVSPSSVRAHFRNPRRSRPHVLITPSRDAVAYRARRGERATAAAANDVAFSRLFLPLALADTPRI